MWMKSQTLALESKAIRCQRGYMKGSISKNQPGGWYRPRIPHRGLGLVLTGTVSFEALSRRTSRLVVATILERLHE